MKRRGNRPDGHCEDDPCPDLTINSQPLHPRTLTPPSIRGTRIVAPEYPGGRGSRDYERRTAAPAFEARALVVLVFGWARMAPVSPS